MVDIKYGTKGVLGAIIGILITIFGWYLFGALADIMPITELKAIYWIGVLLYWVSAIIVLPLMMILSNKGDFKGAVYGLIAFITGFILSLIMYYVIPPILEAFESITPNSTFVGIGWFAVYTVWILSLIIVPSGITLKDTVLEKLGK